MYFKFLVLFALVAYVGADSFYSYNSHEILELNAQHFKENTYCTGKKEGGHSYLVQFYNSTSKISRIYVETYTQIADSVFDWRPIVRLAAVNCDNKANEELCKLHKFDFVPMLKYFRLQGLNNPTYLGEKMTVFFDPQIMSEQLAKFVAEDYSANHYYNWPKFDEFPEISNNTDEIWEQQSKCVSKILFVLVKSLNETNGMTKFIRFSLAVGKEIPIYRIKKTHSLVKTVDVLGYFPFVTTMMISRPESENDDCKIIRENNERIDYESVLRKTGTFNRNIVKVPSGNNTIQYDTPV